MAAGTAFRIAIRHVKLQTWLLMVMQVYVNG